MYIYKYIRFSFFPPHFLPLARPAQCPRGAPAHFLHGERHTKEARGRSSPRHPERCPEPRPPPKPPSRRTCFFELRGKPRHPRTADSCGMRATLAGGGKDTNTITCGANTCPRISLHTPCRGGKPWHPMSTWTLSYPPNLSPALSRAFFAFELLPLASPPLFSTPAVRSSCFTSSFIY